MAVNDATVFKKAIGSLHRIHLAYILPDLLKLANRRGSESLRMILLEYAPDMLPLEERFSDVGYRSSQPNWRLEIACTLYLWIVLIGLGWGLGLVLKDRILSSEMRLGVQILVSSLLAVGAGVLLIKRLSEARYRLSCEGIEFVPLFRKRFFVPWKSVSAVRLIGYREYELSWDSRSVRIRNTFNENSYLPHLILSHVGETATLDEHFMLRRELWMNPKN
ncbi:MAG TPA: hypothetical protein PLI09_17770 [Candidatus Hydrogenedentes bacterium]|nr:hypothetical protein [Candidatus Hydrogenedentota bacterium]